MKWLENHWVTVLIVLVLLYALYYWSKQKGGISAAFGSLMGGSSTSSTPSGVPPG